MEVSKVYMKISELTNQVRAQAYMLSIVNSDSLIAKELWHIEQTSPSGCALRIGSFTAVIS